MPDILKISDLVASSIGQTLNIINGGSFDANNFAVGVLLRAGGRQLDPYLDDKLPTISLLTKGNLIAGIMNGLYAKYNKKSNNEAVKVAVQSAIGNILGTEILNRLNVEDKTLI